MGVRSPIEKFAVASFSKFYSYFKFVHFMLWFGAIPRDIIKSIQTSVSSFWDMRYKEADGERCDLKDLLGQRLRSQPKEKDQKTWIVYTRKQRSLGVVNSSWGKQSMKTTAFIYISAEIYPENQSEHNMLLILNLANL